MQAWRIAKERYALDRAGTGSQRTGGRWNSQGVAVIYAGLTPGVCALEKLVHTSDHLIADLVLVSIQLPDEESLYKKYLPSDLLSLEASDGLKGHFMLPLRVGHFMLPTPSHFMLPTHGHFMIPCIC